MRNLLAETLEAMSSGGVGPNDVRWVGSPEFGHTTWENFAAVAQVTDYDPGYGAPEVATDLVVVGDDWWLTRGEYDGMEWWEFNRLPDKPDAQQTITTLSGGMWDSLAEIHAALREAGVES